MGMNILVKAIVVICFIGALGTGICLPSQIEVPQSLDSPLLQKLRTDLPSHSEKALDKFWRKISLEGTPLVEPIKGDDQNLLVTFLWRSSATKKYIVVFPLAWRYPLRNLMARLPGTDVWYKSYRFRKDARFVYLISANDSLTPFAVENSDTDWLSTLIPDPLNRNRFIQPRDPE